MNCIAENDNGVVVVTPHLGPGGDTLQLRRLKDAVVKQHKPEVKAIVLDLSQIDFIDSGVIGAIVGSCRYLAQKGCAFVVCGVGLRVAETLYIMNLHRALPIRMAKDGAIQEITKAGNRDLSMAGLLAKNPTIDAVRKWWQESAQARVVVPRPKAEVFKEPARAPTPTPATIGDSESTLAMSKCEAAQDWLRALRLFREAKTLSTRYGLEFSASMTFRDFLTEMADRLEPQDHDA